MAYPGDTVRILCNSDVSPIWYKGDTPLYIRGRYSKMLLPLGHHYLIIEDVHYLDTGEYFCIGERKPKIFFRKRFELLVGSKNHFIFLILVNV